MRPVADDTLRACIFGVTARDPRTWGHHLARLRSARGQSPAVQAAAINVSEAALAAASLCRLPRPGRRAEDIGRVSDFAGIGVEVLERLLLDAGSLGDPSTATPAGGAA